MRNRPRTKSVLSLKLFQRYYFKNENLRWIDKNGKETSSCEITLQARSVKFRENNEDGN